MDNLKQDTILFEADGQTRLMSIFEDEECQCINKMTEGMEQINRLELLGNLAFARDIADKNDEDILSLIDGVYAKIDNLSDGEWDKVKKIIPFPVSITSDDTEDIPADEEI